MEFRGQFSETPDNQNVSLTHFSDVGSHTKVMLRHQEWNRVVTGEIIDGHFVGQFFILWDQLLRNDILYKIGIVTIPNYYEDDTDTFVLCRGEDTSSSLYILHLDALVIPVTGQEENTPMLRHQNAFRSEPELDVYDPPDAAPAPAPVRVLFP